MLRQPCDRAGTRIINLDYRVVRHIRMDCDRTKLDILWKRYNAVSSTSSHKQYFEEREAPSSRYPVFQDLQIYTQSNLIPLSAPADLQALSGTSTDSNGGSMSGSFYGTNSSYVPIIRRYIQVPLVATPSPCGMAYQSPKCVVVNNSAGNSPPFTAGETLKGMTSGALAALVTQQGAVALLQAVLWESGRLCGGGNRAGPHEQHAGDRGVR